MVASMYDVISNEHITAIFSSLKPLYTFYKLVLTAT